MDLYSQFIPAVQKGDLVKVRQLLAQQPDLAYAQTESGLSAVLLAAYYSQPAIASLLAGERRDLNIFEACAVGDLEQVNALVGARPELANAIAPDGFQPLGLACFFGHYEVARFLVESGVEINFPSKNSQKVMPLHSAAASRSLDIARLLLEHGADPDARQDGGFTPLHEAAANGQLALVRLLVAHGADVNLSQTPGQTALAFARQAGHKDVVEFLLHHGASN